MSENKHIRGSLSDEEAKSARSEDLDSDGELKPASGEATGEAFAALSLKRQIFVREYLRHFNAKNAAEAAGYANPRTGYELLRYPTIQAAVEEEAESRRRRLALDADRVVEELSMIAFSDIADYVDVVGEKLMFKDLAEIPPDKRRAISEVQEIMTEKSHRFHFKLHDKLAALTLICKHLRIAPDRLVLEGDPSRPLRHQHQHQHAFELPPKPATIEEWERQVQDAAARRALEGPESGEIRPEDLEDEEFD